MPDLTAPYFIMPENEWLDLCEQQCVARCKQDNDAFFTVIGVVCSECARDAAERVPVKYHVAKSELEAAGVELLPGLSRIGLIP